MVLTQILLKEWLAYFPDTGQFVYHYTGQQAKHLNSDGYLIIKIAGRRYRAARLAWLYVHGEWPSNQVDHKNRIRNDDRLSNLRDVTPKINSANTVRLRPYGKMSFQLYWRPDRNRWRLRSIVGKKRTSLGCFLTKEEAVQHYEKVLTSLEPILVSTVLTC